MTTPKFTDYSKEEIVAVINRVIEETEENRTKALEFYEIMAKRCEKEPKEIYILAQYMDKYLDQATKSTENLVKLSAVMQRLLQAEKPTGQKERSVFDSIMEEVYTQEEQKQLKDKPKGPYA